MLYAFQQCVYYLSKVRPGSSRDQGCYLTPSSPNSLFASGKNWAPSGLFPSLEKSWVEHMGCCITVTSTPSGAGNGAAGPAS